MNALFPLAFSALIMIGAMIVSMKRGAVGLIASGIALGAALAALLCGFQAIPALTEKFAGFAMGWKTALGISAVLGFFVYLCFRIVGGWVVKWFFNPDSPFEGLAEGFPGAILAAASTIPLILAFWISCRVVGTAYESAQALYFGQINFPSQAWERPASPVTGWRNGIDAIPMIPVFLDMVDPISRRRSRNATGLVLASMSKDFREFLVEMPQVESELKAHDWEAQSADPDLIRAIERQDIVGLLMAPAIHELAASVRFRKDLAELPLSEILSEYRLAAKPTADSPIVPQR
ncbi:MAG: hypothetical protein AAF236_15555 [Verrucomicrobiota bacterium]